MSKTHIYLVRHGEPEASIRGRCYGKLDVALSPKGEQQIRESVPFFQDVSLQAIYSSPRRRASQSASIIAERKSLPVREESALSEINFGLFDGMLYEEAERLYPQIYQEWMQHPTKVHFPEGESFQIFQARVLQAFQRIREAHAGESVAIFSHGGINRTILASVLRMQDEDIFRLGQSYAAINHIEWFGEFPVVMTMNQIFYKS
jgi:alpha-ribazole phosphatase